MSAGLWTAWHVEKLLVLYTYYAISGQGATLKKSPVLAHFTGTRKYFSRAKHGQYCQYFEYWDWTLKLKITTFGTCLNLASLGCINNLWCYSMWDITSGAAGDDDQRFHRSHSNWSPSPLSSIVLMVTSYHFSHWSSPPGSSIMIQRWCAVLQVRGLGQSCCHHLSTFP